MSFVFVFGLDAGFQGTCAESLQVGYIVIDVLSPTSKLETRPLCRGLQNDTWASGDTLPKLTIGIPTNKMQLTYA